MIISEELNNVQKEAFKDALDIVESLRRLEFKNDNRKIREDFDENLGLIDYYDNHGVKIYRQRKDSSRNDDTDESYWIVDEKYLYDTEETSLKKMFKELPFSFPMLQSCDLLSKGRVMNIRISNNPKLKLEPFQESIVKPPYYSITYGCILTEPTETVRPPRNSYSYTVIVDSNGNVIKGNGVHDAGEINNIFNKEGDFSNIGTLELLQYIGVDRDLLLQYRDLLSRDGGKIVNYGADLRANMVQYEFHREMDTLIEELVDPEDGKTPNLKELITEMKRTQSSVVSGVRKNYEEQLNNRTVDDISKVTFLDKVRQLINKIIDGFIK